jgi:putative endonuclease
MVRGGYVYIITNKTHTVLYVGVTSNIKVRIKEHQLKKYPNSFTAKYNCNKLVWYQAFNDIVSAIEEEKRIKGGSRLKKEALINSLNPEWIDLFDELPNEI